MDFTTIKKKLNNGHYADLSDGFRDDVYLVFRNAEKFNRQVCQAAAVATTVLLLRRCIVGSVLQKVQHEMNLIQSSTCLRHCRVENGTNYLKLLSSFQAAERRWIADNATLMRAEFDTDYDEVRDGKHVPNRQEVIVVASTNKL